MSISFILAFVSEAAGAEAHGEGGGLLSVNPGLAFWAVLTFLLLLLILKKFAWKPILEALNTREKEIEHALEAAKKTNEETAKLAEVNKQLLAKAEEEGQKVIQQAREHAEKLRAQLEEQAKTAADKRLAEAKSEIERMKKDALNEIKNEIADISLQVAEKMIKSNLDSERNKEIVNNYIDEIRKN